MTTTKTLLAAALTAAATTAGVALASGGPPPPDPPAPVAGTLVAHGSAQSDVAKPAKRTDATIERAVRAARSRAVPRAIAVARAEATVLAKSIGVKLGGPIGIARDAAPVGYWEPENSRFGPGQWCGRIVSSRFVRRADGTRRRITRSRYGCDIPNDAQLRVTVTFTTG